MAAMLPRLFFAHFSGTSLIAHSPDGELAAFAIAFISYAVPRCGYIHFVGVAPALRGHGLGREVYGRLFAMFSEMGCERIDAVTSPVNTGSIAFHRAMGFTAIGSPSCAMTGDGVPYWPDYDGPGEDRVLFTRPLPGR